MRKIGLALLIVTAAAAGCGRSEVALQPKHIEVPDYDRTANIVHIQGEVLARVIIDATGNVTGVQLTGPPLLFKGVEANIRSWTFENPKHLPTNQSIIYEFRIEGSPDCAILPSSVSFDLPDHVNVVAHPVHTCDPVVAIQKKSKQNRIE